MLVVDAKGEPSLRVCGRAFFLGTALFGFGVLLGSSAWTKSIDSAQFIADLRRHGLMLGQWAPPAGRLWILVEWAVAGLLIVSSLTSRVRALAIGVAIGTMCAMLIYLLTVGATQGWTLDCGCSGGVETSIARAAVRNLGLLLLLALAAAVQRAVGTGKQCLVMTSSASSACGTTPAESVCSPPAASPRARPRTRSGNRRRT